MSVLVLYHFFRKCLNREIFINQNAPKCIFDAWTAAVPAWEVKVLPKRIGLWTGTRKETRGRKGKKR